MVGSSIFQLLLSLFLLSSFWIQPSYAIKKSYIVYLGSHSHGPNPTSIDVDAATNSHYNLLGSVLGSNKRAQEAIIYSYSRKINGFAAELEEEEASEIAKDPNVVSVFLSRMRKLHTTRSWEFLGLESNGVTLKNSIWEKARYGEDTIIANLDTGVWPESKSFSDKGMGPIPAKWKGKCELDNLHNSNKRLCNRKLVGARFFIKGYESFLGKQNESSYTARDVDGHGTHTLSTAGGNFVKGASVLGNGYGTAKGGSPKAKVAAYKVCWPPINSTAGGGCFDADILAGFEAAISDGVDVISASIGGTPTDLFSDAIAIGSFHATSKGILVVSSAGNSGPASGSVSNVSPWMLTVAASTLDREFTSYVALGDRKHLKGASLSSMSLPSQKFYPLISSEDARLPNATPHEAQLCYNGTLDPKKVKGKILVCLRGEFGRTEKGEVASFAGAVGMILANDALSLDDTMADPHVLPTSNVNYDDGQYVYNYIKHNKDPLAYMTKSRTEVPIKPAPVMAAFSSRGPNIIQPSILKPDITAPGVNILAAYSEATGPTELASDKRRFPFDLLSGTSMSCPHVSGIVGLLKTLYPDWSPAAIKSAIMTTASTLDSNKTSLLDSNLKRANPFAYGAGHVQPELAMNPGLVYDLTTTDYLNFLCGYGYTQTQLKVFSPRPFTCPKSYNVANFNYPSITVTLGPDPVKVTRTVTNVGPPSTYHVDFRVPKGLKAFVEPNYLRFKKVGEKKSFQVRVEATGMHKPANYSFGELWWSNGKNIVRSPIVVQSK
ncbi:subtilisin-like protease SBT5.4 [Senna tora]|uniref:Subtilisin-like protease SBT5.4 n=1 Tax=Senna tora TaxID=362788 RepID=A0A834WB88_9FABA|nr:subtilisin-like protease SBT5.4 [Senna tora]